MAQPSRCNRLYPPRSVPASLAALPLVQGTVPPEAHAAHASQRGMKVMTTRWPDVRSTTFSPQLSTMPAASWPKSIGVGRCRDPFTTDRSE